MPRSAIDALVEQRLAEGEETGARYIDMRVDLVDETTRESYLVAGGKWDRRDKRMSERRADVRRVLTLQPAQIDAMRWFAEWFGARRLTEYLYTEFGKPIFSVCLIGGRRAGKGDLGVKIIIAYACDNPRSICWIIVPTMPDSPEIERALEENLPAHWYTYLGDPLFVYTLENGSEIYLKTAAAPKGLKKGRVDIVLINEAQDHPKKTFLKVRPAIADKGGIVIIVANPPDGAAGWWVEEHIEKIRDGRIGGVVFELDSDLNPHVSSLALTSIADEVDEDEYEREIKGKFGMARPGAVFFGYSSTNLERAPLHAGISAAFLQRHLGIAADRLHGVDFQLNPHQISSTLRFYEDPYDARGDPLVWIVDEVVVEQGTEDDLIDAMQKHFLWTDGVERFHCGLDPVVADASGDWQDSERTVGGSSWDIFRKRGWRRLYHPDANSRKNPPISERVKIGNSLLKAGKLRVDPVRCPHTARAMRLWCNKNGQPDRRSEHAHSADTWSYPTNRLFPRRAQDGGRAIQTFARVKSTRRREFDEAY